MSLSLLDSIPHMDTQELHLVADQWNWDDGLSELHAIIENRQCALGTAVMLYWRGHPHYYRKFTSWEAIPAYNLGPYKLLEQIEQHMQAGFYQHHGVTYDPRNDHGTDFTRCMYKASALKRDLPAYVFE